MQNLSLVNMQAKVDLAKTEVQSLLATTKARNVTFPCKFENSEPAIVDVLSPLKMLIQSEVAF